jgi:hypothetical protein
LGVATGFDTIAQETEKKSTTIVTTASQLYCMTIVITPIVKTQQQIQ